MKRRTAIQLSAVAATILLAVVAVAYALRGERLDRSFHESAKTNLMRQGYVVSEEKYSRHDEGESWKLALRSPAGFRVELFQASRHGFYISCQPWGSDSYSDKLEGYVGFKSISSDDFKPLVVDKYQVSAADEAKMRRTIQDVWLIVTGR